MLDRGVGGCETARIVGGAQVMADGVTPSGKMFIYNSGLGYDPLRRLRATK
jgi:hypothetical protein